MSRLMLLRRSLRWLPGLLMAGPGSKRTVAELIERHAARRPEHVFVRFEGRSLSYGAYNTAANRVAHWALEKGFGRGDVVALLMENRPEYLEIWAGLAKTGATIALLNTNVSGRALAHVLEACQCRALILGAECVERWESLGEASPQLALYVARDPGAEQQPSLPRDAQSFDKEVAGYSAENPPRYVRAELRGRDPLFYIYTSGTTGLPKAARFSHARFMGTGMFSLLAGFGRSDTMYCALPLYHTAGGAMAVNAVLRAGGTLALRRRFSATRFWSDVLEMDATCFQYIGEVCRYLLAQPPSERDRAHRVRFCVGNGLRPDIWETFQERFAIPKVIEFYGATESNVAMVNLDGRVGSVGKPTPGAELALVRYDVTANTHVRDAQGHCVRCSDGEVGELLGRIAEVGIAAARFEGYTSKEATEKKVLRDVFAKGDAWFRTGDLLRCDQEGFYYFVDRLGDTFRWKGENVSTQEVAENLGALPGIELCSVFGVEVPGSDGRAGMAALVLDCGVALDGAAIYSQVEDALPAYARPVFLRVQKQAELTGTLKLRKVDLQRQGFDPGAVTDPLYYSDDQSRSYRPLDGDAYARIRAGSVRF
ncbi:MAG: long-chain-acyl-CoA synthetase [Deltaproteobacteria bacterium]|nr:long-chain-acyl-CoA synthetase [Deltaproteobacteria bacterium]